MTTRANLYVDQGVDFAVVLDLFDTEGTGFSITDQTFKCEAKKVFSSSANSSNSFEAEVVVNTDDADTNDLNLIISASATTNVQPGKYQYDIIMSDGTDRYKLLEGLIFLLPTITTV